MCLFNYHVSHEQFSPSDLLDYVRQAESAGFDGAFSSDHLQPWSSNQGQSGYAWSWLGAAMQATMRLTFGVITVPGGWRYHPVVLAQAIATLGQMFPGRLPWIAVGSGEAINERVIGSEWPDKAERNRRMCEGAQIMSALLAGDAVTRRGRLTAANARIWSRPARPTKIVGATTTAATAEWLGTWADGLLTTNPDVAALREIIEAFRSTAGPDKPIFLKMQISWADSAEEALANAYEQWRSNVLGADASWELPSPEDFERATRFVRPEDMCESVAISADLQQHSAWLRERVELGVDAIAIHNVGANQSQFIEAFGRHVLPALRR